MGDSVRDDGLLAQVLALELRRDSSLTHNKHAIGDTDDFRQFGGDDDDRFAFRREAFDEAVDLRLRSNVDAPCRLVEQQNLAVRRNPSGDDRLLLRRGGASIRL